ncbi:hypothetical protein ACJJTC_015451 [Scirpophaga incertulas]
MPLTAAERQRRYKAKLKQNPEKYEESKRKNYHVKKRLVSDLSTKEKRFARVIWRLRKQKIQAHHLRLQASEGPRPSCTKQSEDNIENHGVKAGDFKLVNVKSNSRKIYKYVCVVNELQDDGDITDTILRSVKHKNTFTMVHHDVSVIDYRDIVEILSKPTQIIKRGHIYYNFNRVIDINEK